MSDHDLHEPLQSLPPVLDHIITEPVRKDLAWQRWDCDASRFTLKDVAEVLEVGVAAADLGVLDVEGRNIGAAFDQVSGVHWDAGFGRVGDRVFDLEKGG